MNLVVFVSVALGLLLGATGGYLVSRRLVLRIAVSARRPPVVRVSAGFAGLVALAPSAFVAFIVGGNFGGDLGASLLPEAVGVPIGLALGIGGILALCLLAGSLSGALLGCGVSAVIGRAHEA